jgi:hypothetical protein
VRTLPVLVISFNRPDFTSDLLANLGDCPGIAVYVSIDGPRRDVDSDVADVLEVERVVRQVDGMDIRDVWSAESNLGCGPHVGSAIRRFFDTVPEGVVLEDDCLPTPAFFDYARWALSNFRERSDVGVISGVSYANTATGRGTLRNPYLSRYPQIWGWASWRSRIRGFNYLSNMSGTNLRRSTAWKSLALAERVEWLRSFRRQRRGGWKNNWDVQFVHHCWSRNLMSVAPPFPLVANRGFGLKGTHTVGPAPSWYRDPPPPEVLNHFTERLGSLTELDVMSSPELDALTSRLLYSRLIRARVYGRLFGPWA